MVLPRTSTLLLSYVTPTLNAEKCRYEVLNGRKYLVAPMTMLVPGVLDGSQGPLYYPPDEVAKYPGAWDGMPIVVEHPTDEEGNPVWARSPSVLEKSQIGTVFNSYILSEDDLLDPSQRDKVGSLAAEGWFDVEATRSKAPSVLTALKAGKPVELSTGLMTDNDPAPEGSEYNGRPYNYVARNYRADHLAILPDSKGACSLDDGCGVLNGSPSPLADLPFGSSGGAPDAGGGEVGVANRVPQPATRRGDAPPIRTVEDSNSGTDPHSLTPLPLDSPGLMQRVIDGLKYYLTGNAGYLFSGRGGARPFNPGRQPKSRNTGRFKRPGAGTGTGAVYDAALKGAMTHSEQDRKIAESVIAGDLSCVVDEKRWETAKEKADAAGYNARSDYWACVSYIYRGLGGTYSAIPTGNQAAESAPYGKCPICGAPGVMRERRPGGNDRCENGHEYPSREAVHNHATTEPSTNENDMNRKQLISYLTTNCDCWKGEEATLNKFSDDKLKNLVEITRNARTVSIVVNAKNAHAPTGTAKHLWPKLGTKYQRLARIANAAYVVANKKASPKNAEGDAGEVAGIDIAALAEFLGVMTDPASDPVAFIAELKGMLDEIQAKIGASTPAPAPEEADVAMEDPEMMKPEEEEAVNEDDEETKNEGEESKGTDGATYTEGNGAKTGNRKRLAPASQRLTREEQEAIQFARNEKNKQRSALIRKLTVNLKGTKLNKMLGRLNAMTLAELQDFAAVYAPTTNAETEERRTDYTGAAGYYGHFDSRSGAFGGPVANSDGSEDEEEPLDFEEARKQYDPWVTRNQRTNAV